MNNNNKQHKHNKQGVVYNALHIEFYMGGRNNV